MPLFQELLMNISKGTFRPIRVAIRRSLRDRGISQVAFAKACGLSDKHVCNVLRGNKPLGELTAFKLQAGIRQLGLPVEFAT